MSHVYLEVVKGLETGRLYKVSDGANSIGRDGSNAIAILPQERSVSGHHAILYKTSDGIRIQDLQSTNGLYVDESRISERELRSGMIIGLGKRGPRLSLKISQTEIHAGRENDSGGTYDQSVSAGQFAPKSSDFSSTGGSYQPEGGASFVDDQPLSNASFQGGSSHDEQTPLSNASFQNGGGFADDQPLSNASFQGGSSHDGDAPLSNASFQKGGGFDDDQPLSNASFQGGSSHDDQAPLSNASFQKGGGFDDASPLSNASFQGGSSHDEQAPLSNASFQKGGGFDDASPLSNASFQGGSSHDEQAPLSNASFQKGGGFDDAPRLSNASFQGGFSHDDQAPLSNASFQKDDGSGGDQQLSNASFQGNSSFAADTPLSNASFKDDSPSFRDERSNNQSFDNGSFFDGAQDYKMAKEKSRPDEFEDDSPSLNYRSAGIGDIKIIDDESGLSGDMAPPSSTMAVEQKFIEKNINADDIHDLMKNDGRLNRLVDRGNLGQTQANMLLSVQSASKRVRTQSLVILSSVIGVALIVISFFAVRAYQYKAMVNKGLSLEEKLDSYEMQISKVNDNPDDNQEKLSQLLEDFEKTQTELKQVKSELKEGDYEKFYDDPLEQKIDNVMSRFGEDNYHIPPQMVERVRYHIEIYSGRMKGTIGRYLKRKEKYFPMIERIFKAKNLPIELAYVSMLESGFNPKALSHAGARGLWQFMPRTGRSYGLQVADQIDERLDPEKATYAAAEYFRDLIAIFGGRSSMMLAMAAYNAGEGRVMGALKKIDDPMRDRDFWYIYRMGYLAEETNEYIPRIIALMLIDQNSAEFGFESNGRAAPSPDLEDERDFMEVDFGKDPFGIEN